MTDHHPDHRPRRAAFLLALSACLWIGAASAQSPDAPEPYRLAVGDKVSVLVFGQPDFSTEIVLDETGTVALPLLGSVPLGGLTPVEAEKAIASRLSQGYLEKPAVTVRLQEARPVYVMGKVRNPGSYPFRPGLSALAAVALAGGFGTPEQITSGTRAEYLQAQERLGVLERSQRQLLVRRARLEAQRDDKPGFELPEGFVQDGDREMRVQEEELLKAQRQAQSERLHLLQAQKPRLRAEIEGVKAQLAAERQQLELIQTHLQDYNHLMSQGLARRYTGIELQREEARNKGNIGRFTADLARLDNGIGEIDLRINEASEAYLRRIMTELAEASQKLRELELTIPIARELREAKLLQGGEMPADDPALRIVVMRAGPSGRKAIEASADLLLRPGDIVEITRKPSAPARSFSSLSGDSSPVSATR